MRTIVHVSDLHFGRTRPDLLGPLLDAIHAVRPDLVAVSGDLTQRARRGQFAAARHFLTALPQPFLVVPGNHDIPLDAAWTRLLAPWGRYRRWIGRNLEPWFEDGEIAVLGINTVAPFLWQRGRIARRTLARACARLGEADGRTRIVVTHHPLVHAPEHVGKALMHGAATAISSLAACGADILLSGHLHAWRAEPYRTLAPDARAVLLVQAGTGLSTRVRTGGNDYNVLHVEAGAVTIRRFATADGLPPFSCVEEKRFVRDAAGWRA